MVAARSFGMAVNRLIDAGIDARNPRTAGRELPAGRLKRYQVWLFAVASLAVLIVATFNLPVITRYLWPVVVVPMVIYPLHQALDLALPPGAGRRRRPGAGRRLGGRHRAG